MHCEVRCNSSWAESARGGECLCHLIDSDADILDYHFDYCSGDRFEKTWDLVYLTDSPTTLQRLFATGETIGLTVM